MATAGYRLQLDALPANVVQSIISILPLSSVASLILTSTNVASHFGPGVSPGLWQGATAMIETFVLAMRSMEFNALLKTAIDLCHTSGCVALPVLQKLLRCKGQRTNLLQHQSEVVQPLAAMAHHIFRAVLLRLTPAAEWIKFTRKWTDATRALWCYTWNYPTPHLSSFPFQPSWDRIVSDTVSDRALNWTPQEALEMYKCMPARCPAWDDSDSHLSSRDPFLLSLKKDSDDGLTDFLFHFNLPESDVFKVISTAPGTLNPQELQALLVDQAYHELYQTFEELKSFRVPLEGWSREQVKDMLESLWHPPLVAEQSVKYCLRLVRDLFPTCPTKEDIDLDHDLGHPQAREIQPKTEFVNQLEFQDLFEKIYAAKNRKEELMQILGRKCALAKCGIRAVALLTRWCLARDDRRQTTSARLLLSKDRSF